MPIFPPGQSSDRNGFPAYREYASIFYELNGQSIKVFEATGNRQQRQLYLMNEGPSDLFIHYGEEASAESPQYITEGNSWLDSHDGGMAVYVWGEDCQVKGFIRSEGPIILPEPTIITANVLEINDASWVIPAPTQPSFQVFKALNTMANITILDPQNIMRDNSFGGVDLYIGTNYNGPDASSYGVDGSDYFASFPQDPNTYQNLAPFTFEWNTLTGFYGSPAPYFWIKTNLDITDYLWRFFAMKVVGPGLLEIVDYQTY